MNKETKKKLYWPPAVTIDVVIFTIEDNDLKVLLIKRNREPYKEKRALPGGFLLSKEATGKAALRILREKAGVGKVYLEQLYTFDNLERDPRGHVLTVSYFALINRDKIKFASNKDAQAPEFYSVSNLSKLAFDHKNIIEYAVRRLRYKLEYTNVIYSLMPATFTFGNLQKVHETILDRKLDKRNFRKKFLSLGLIQPTRKKFSGIRQRPAQLYTFAQRNPLELKRFI